MEAGPEDPHKQLNQNGNYTLTRLDQYRFYQLMGISSLRSKQVVLAAKCFQKAETFNDNDKQESEMTHKDLRAELQDEKIPFFSSGGLVQKAAQRHQDSGSELSGGDENQMAGSGVKFNRQLSRGSEGKLSPISHTQKKVDGRLMTSNSCELDILDEDEEDQLGDLHPVREKPVLIKPNGPEMQIQDEEEEVGDDIVYEDENETTFDSFANGMENMLKEVKQEQN
jgi:hypothetical protein